MKKTLFLIFACLVISTQSCDVLQQASQVGNLVNCSFSLKSVEGLTLAGVNVQNVQSMGNLNIMDATRLAGALTGSSLPLDFTLNVEARNPNASPAGMTQLDWILLIDNIEMTHGVLNKRVTIPGNHGSAVIPVQMGIDLRQALSGKSGDALLNFAMNLAGAGNKPTRFTLKAKPTIKVGDYLLAYPGYITINAQ